MIIYGTKSTKKDLGNAISATTCQYCGGTHQQRLVRRKRWISLFFIPIIPIRTEFFTICPQCRAVLDVDKATGQQIADDIKQASNT